MEYFKLWIVEMSGAAMVVQVVFLAAIAASVIVVRTTRTIRLGQQFKHQETMAQLQPKHEEALLEIRAKYASDAKQLEARVVKADRDDSHRGGYG